MKKIIFKALIILGIVSMLTACSKTFKCELCLDTVTGREYKEELFGEEISICKDCKEGLEKLNEMFEE